MNKTITPSNVQETIKKISVVMCTYNGEKYLREQLDSIVNQTYPIHELLIQDDCSTDHTTEIVREYAERYPFIRLNVNETQAGINKNFFSAMRHSTGEYIAISDQDDIWEPTKLETQIERIGDKLLCAGMSKPFSAEGISVVFDSRRPNYSLIRMLYVGMLPGHTMLVHRSILDMIPESTLTYDLQIQMAAASMDSIEFVDDILVNQRRHTSAATLTKPVNRSFSFLNIFSMIKETLKLFIEIKPQMQQNFKTKETFLQQLRPPYRVKIVESAIQMAHLQTQRSVASYLKLTLLCLKLRDHLFHVKDTNRVRAVLRALYFPIFGCHYFRYMSKDFKRV